MKIVIINLKHNKKRLKNITNNLQNLGINNYQIFDAIYGKNLSKQEIKNNTTFMARNFLCNYGMIGCAMSHIKIWKDFLNSKDKLILISEDDVEYNNNFPDFLNNIYNIYDKIRFDILNINTSVGIFSSFSKSIFIDNYELNKPIFPLTMASYIISKTGAKRLLNIITDKISYHIDFLIAKENFFYNLNYYSLKNINILNVSYTNDSNLISNNNGFLNYILEILGLDKINWLLSNNACCLFLKYSISVYSLILFIIIIIFLFIFINKKVKCKTYLILLILVIEFLLVNL